MVNVKFFVGNFGVYGCSIVNHAGDPLVCASVSAIGMMLLGALENVPDVHFIDSRHGDGFIHVEISPFVDEDKQKEVDVIFKTTYIGLKQLERSYPERIEVLGQVEIGGYLN